VTRSVLLGSASPRRRLLLEQAGWGVEQVAPAIDDGRIHLETDSPPQIVEALAWFKAAQIGPPCHPHVACVSADTVCVVDGEILGKPRDREHAARMIGSMVGRRHQTITGVCVRDRAGGRLLFSDVASVEIGDLSPETLDRYLDSGEWNGKAGGYNLIDRVEDGWPLACVDDPTTVMGLPIRRLIPILDRMDRMDRMDRGHRSEGRR
jgi:septum formation protein